ncbi:unnamed protein product [Parnassius mnemosyne]|uniref:Uncharacterized protein n=1 Tax=Parnassius mnemosyne TaxID=213953 RepID=A0AAV1KZP8_9NEOP
MTPREHREAKKKWKEYCTKYRNKKKVLSNITNMYMRDNTPDSDVSNSSQMPTAEVVEVIRQTNYKEKLLRYNTKKEKDKEIRVLKKKLLKYKKRLSRLKKKAITERKDTPNTKLLKMADTPKSRKDLVKKALFGEVLKEQLQENFSEMKTLREKRLLAKVVLGKIVDKYKLWRMKDTGVITYKRIKKAKMTHKQVRKPKVSHECVRVVVNFYEDDSNSRLGAGKKEFITRKAERKQKRYMLDSLLGLYKKFQHQKSNFKLSYQTFCRLRPFWIVIPKINKRDTCLCINHANIDFINSFM